MKRPAIHPEDVDEFLSDLDRANTIDDVAYYLGVHRRTVSRWIASGQLDAFKRGSRVFILKGSLRRFIAPTE